MADEQLYTLRQLADQLSLPESTVRYYRDAFLDHIPSVGTGRRRRYPAQAVAVLRSIAKAYAAGRPRNEIIASIHEPSTPAVAVQSEATQRTVQVDEVTNLDLLAAILDGEREQRDALWQMAKEIVRLTEVLEGQDRVLGDIASQAGVSIGGAAPRPMLERPAAPLLHSPPAPPLPPAAQAEVPVMPAPGAPAAHTTPFVPFMNDAPPIAEPLPRSMFGDDESLAKLREELERERALVEKLRESRLALEHRAADAEAALEERSQRRPSMIRRILGNTEP